MNLIEIERFLNNHEIPVSKETIGFLEIIGKQHHENINSVLYAHFINCANEEVKRLFLDTLLELVNHKSKKTLSLSPPFAQTEVNTGKGRIDILISDPQKNNSIIIENKLYHNLDNDLMDYWQFVYSEDSQKVGVLLTLHSHPVPDHMIGKFVNITHLEWIELVKNRINYESLPQKYSVYISDFISTIENLTKKYKMNDSAKFYFLHAQKIIEANHTMLQAHNFIDNQLELIASSIGWETYGNSMDWRNFWDEENELETYLTIITKDLFEGKLGFTLILELYGKDLGRENDLRDHLRLHPQLNDKKRGFSFGSYTHFICKDYKLAEDELSCFADVVIKKIHEDFANITVMAIRYLYPNIEICKWEDKFLGKMNV